MERNNLSIAMMVISLTLMTCLSQVGCSFIEPYYGEICKSHAYVQVPVNDYVQQRFFKNAQVRLGIMPFSTPGNLLAQRPDLPGVGEKLAIEIQALLLKAQLTPIVEIVDLHHFPARGEEFFTGNYEALRRAYNAGYDLLLVGSVENPSQIDTLGVYTKLIDVSSNVTLWYGKVDIRSIRNDVRNANPLLPSQPDMLHIGALVDRAAQCTVRKITFEPGSNVSLWERVIG